MEIPFLSLFINVTVLMMVFIVLKLQMTAVMTNEEPNSMLKVTELISINIKHALYPWLLVKPYVVGDRTTNEQSCIVGQNIQISWTFAGIEKPEVTWSFNGQSLSTGERFQINETEDGTSTLSIRATELTDKGVYTTRATNSVGTVEATTNLKISNIKPTILTDLEDTLQAIRGKSISMMLVFGGQPNSTVTWMRNNTKIIPEDNIQIIVPITENDNKYTLTILNVQPSDEGEYFAKVSNAAGSIESKKCTVNVRSKSLYSDKMFQKRKTLLCLSL